MEGGVVTGKERTAPIRRGSFWVPSLPEILIYAAATCAADFTIEDGGQHFWVRQTASPKLCCFGRLQGFHAEVGLRLLFADLDLKYGMRGG